MRHKHRVALDDETAASDDKSRSHSSPNEEPQARSAKSNTYFNEREGVENTPIGLESSGLVDVAFLVLDLDNDGMLSPDDISGALQRAGIAPVSMITIAHTLRNLSIAKTLHSQEGKYDTYKIDQSNPNKTPLERDRVSTRWTELGLPTDSEIEQCATAATHASLYGTSRPTWPRGSCLSKVEFVAFLIRCSLSEADKSSFEKDAVGLVHGLVQTVASDSLRLWTESGTHENSDQLQPAHENSTTQSFSSSGSIFAVDRQPRSVPVDCRQKAKRLLVEASGMEWKDWCLPHTKRSNDTRIGSTCVSTSLQLLEYDAKTLCTLLSINLDASDCTAWTRD
jgi:hypothetical protein